MEMESKSLGMEICTRVNIKMVSFMGEGNITGLMVLFMMEILYLDIEKVVVDGDHQEKVEICM